MLTKRRIAAIFIPTLLAAPHLSSSLVHPFVRDGEYERALDLAADCNRTYVPAMSEADRREAEEGRYLWAGVRLAYAGSELAYLYRPKRIDAAHLSDITHDYEWLDGAASGRMESYEEETRATTMASYADSQGGCTKIMISVDPAVLKVGIRGTQNDIATDERFLQLVAPHKDFKNPLRTIAVDPAENRGKVTIRVYENGKLVPNREILVRTDPRGIPGRYGRTIAHDHLLKGTTQAIPTIRIQGQRANFPGEEVVLRTDGHGERTFWVQPGYRGGAEAIIARPKSIAGKPEILQPAARPVVVSFGPMRHFAEVFGFSNANPPKPSPEFPFLLVGSTSKHVINHFVQGEAAHKIANALRSVWSYDPGRLAHKTPVWLQINDMSLEYGGAFKTNEKNVRSDCSNPSEASHYNHDIGLDFDIAPCYSTGPDGMTIVRGSDCRNGNHLMINERFLAAFVIGNYGGALKYEGDHYHVRFPGTGTE